MNRSQVRRTLRRTFSTLVQKVKQMAQSAIDELREQFVSNMISAHEVLEIFYLIDCVQEIEMNRGILFSDEQINMVWCVSVNEAIDSFINNLNETPASDIEGGTEEIERRIAAYESQRPQSIRYKYLAKTFALKG